MTDELSRFTSDRRVRDDASWATQDDWESGVAENIDVTASGVVARPSVQNSEMPDGVVNDWTTENEVQDFLDSCTLETDGGGETPTVESGTPAGFYYIRTYNDPGNDSGTYSRFLFDHDLTGYDSLLLDVNYGSHSTNTARVRVDGDTLYNDRDNDLEWETLNLDISSYSTEVEIRCEYYTDSNTTTDLEMGWTWIRFE